MGSKRTVTHLSIEGPITEGTDLFRLRPDTQGEIHLDLSHMTYINSAGVKSWVIWLTHLPQNCPLIISKAPYVLVNQANMVYGFFPPGARVQSFQSFFVCPDCQTEKQVLLERGVHYDYPTADRGAWYKVPEDILCPKCNVALETDFIPEKAFNFLKNEKPSA